MTDHQNPLRFEFSLTVLNHLGRQLYRNFITVIGEAVSNAWDADAHNVWISISPDRRKMTIVDDGLGMSRDDLQNKFLKIGYSKRKDASLQRKTNRPFIGAKGIGKLALLSCAETVSVITKTSGQPIASCVIDNTELDRAIDEDRTTQEVPLREANADDLDLVNGLDSGTALIFIHPKMSSSKDHFLRKALALFYRFSLVDPDFRIHFNDEEVGVGDAHELAENTQFLWKFNTDFDDPYLHLLAPVESTSITLPEGPLSTLRGFIASVDKPRDLVIFGAGERIGIDLFVNGRLRERNIMSHRPNARVASQYLYGQLHLDSLDTGDTDPFTSNRESVIEDNSLFTTLLDYLDEHIRTTLVEQWDLWRLKNRQDGDDEGKAASKKTRAYRRAIREQKKEFFPKDPTTPENPLFEDLLKRAEEGLEESLDDYSRIFLFENLMRLICAEFDYKLSRKIADTATKHMQTAQGDCQRAEIPKECRSKTELPYFLGLAELLDTIKEKQTRHTKQLLDTERETLRYLRNIVMHTAGLTPFGREQLQALLDATNGALRKTVNEAVTKRADDAADPK